MKKVLFATTALVATAGIAAADVNLGGSARFAMLYTEGAADEVTLHNRFTLNIDGSTETDDGLNFFARVRIRGGQTGQPSGTTVTDSAGDTHTDPSETGSGISAPRVGVSTGGFTFAAGNIAGALESMPGLYDGAVGLTGLNWYNLVTNTSTNRWNWDSFSSSGHGSNGVEIFYASGAFSGGLSWSDSTDHTALNLAYTFGDWTVALGVQDGPVVGDDMVVGTVGGSFGNFGVGASIGDIDGNTSWRLNGNFSVGAGTTLVAYVADDDLATNTVWGAGFTHSLGGAVLAGGVVGNPTGSTEADLGIRFSF